MNSCENPSVDRDRDGSSHQSCVNSSTQQTLVCCASTVLNHGKERKGKGDETSPEYLLSVHVHIVASLDFEAAVVVP